MRTKPAPPFTPGDSVYALQLQLGGTVLARTEVTRVERHEDAERWVVYITDTRRYVVSASGHSDYLIRVA